MSARALSLRIRIEEPRGGHGDGDGEPVLLLHGFGDSLDSFWDSGWASVLAGRKLVAFDARGHGGSPRPAEPEAYADEERVMDALAVLDHVGARRAHVLGYSMGGWTAMRLALDAPERVASLLVGGAQPYGQTLEPLRQLLARGLDAFIGAIERGRTLPAAAKARFLRNDPLALAAVIARDRDAIDTSSLRAPLFVWTGELDALARLVTRFATERGGELVSVPRAGHFAAFDDPVVLRAASSWIAERSTSLSSKRNTWSLPEAST